MSISFDGLLARIGEAAIHAQRRAATAAVKRWEDMCDTDDDGNLIPKHMDIKIGDTSVEVPELSLSHPSVMPLTSLKVKFETQVDLSSVNKNRGEGLAESPSPVISVTPKRGLFSKATHFEVEATFELTEPPESLEVLRDALAQQVKEQLGA